MLTCIKYEDVREEMYDRISEECEIDHLEERDETEQIQIVLGTVERRRKGKELRRIVVDYIKKANEIRQRYVT
jgi:hypothetical protein